MAEVLRWAAAWSMLVLAPCVLIGGHTLIVGLTQVAVWRGLYMLVQARGSDVAADLEVAADSDLP